MSNHATTTIKRGFDVPSANVVISYDHLKDSVELCQRSGRARQLDSSIVILDERHDRPYETLDMARELQDEIVEQYDPSTLVPRDVKGEQRQQQNREKTAFQAILKHPSMYQSHPLLRLNEYVKKTKASLSEEFSGPNNVGSFECPLTYRTILRTIQVNAQATKKKVAKTESALALLVALRSETSCYN